MTPQFSTVEPSVGSCLVQAAALAVFIQLPSFADVAKYAGTHLCTAPDVTT
jgi:hypothetical protein